MHFAYPPRKSSNPPPYLPRTSRLPLLRRNRLRTIALAGLALVGLVYLLLTRPRGHAAPVSHIPSGSPPAIIVTVFDGTKQSRNYIDSIKENRIQYAKKHGYETFFPNVGDYDLHGSPMSWTKVIAMRHAMTKFPDATYFWYLEQNAYVMNPSLSIEGDVMRPARIEEAMIKDHPVVPPDSIIKTFGHLKGQDVDLLLTQDNDGLSTGSFVIRNGEWAQYFFETWFDPLYRSYNFQRAEMHALEHIVQWHPTILSKLAIVPQQLFNAYSRGERGRVYQEGDLAVHFAGCALLGPTKCEEESESFAQQWRAAFKAS